MRKFNINCLVIMLCSVLLVGCGGKQNNGLTVTVSIEPMRYFVEQIADSLVSVDVMVPQGSSPETYEPTPQQMVELANSAAYLRIGNIGFEQNWMDKLQQNVPTLKVYDASEGVDLLPDACADAVSGEMDPHIWTSPKNVKIIAQNICNALVDIDSLHADAYRKNLAAFTKKLDSLDAQIHSKLKSKTSRSFLIYHPTLTYFAHDYGLTQVTVEVSGKEPSPQQLRGLVDQCRQEGIKTIFVQKEFNRRNIDLISKETKTKAQTINPLSYNWSNEMLNISNILADE